MPSEIAQILAENEAQSPFLGRGGGRRDCILRGESNWAKSVQSSVSLWIPRRVVRSPRRTMLSPVPAQQIYSRFSIVLDHEDLASVNVHVVSALKGDDPCSREAEVGRPTEV